MVGVRRLFLALAVCLLEVSGDSRAIRPATSPQDHKVSVPPTTSPEEPQTTLTNLEDGGRADDEKKTYNGAQVLELPTVSKDNIETLIENGDVEHWGQNASFIQVYVGKENLPKVKSMLAKDGVPFNVMINDVQRAIDTENPQMTEEEFEELEGRNGHRMNYQSYHHYRDIHGYMDYVANTYPSLVTVGTLGTSAEGRPLKYVKIKFGDSIVKSFWIDGGIHAREWISPAAVTYIIQELVENHDAHASELDGMEFYILPVMNPDGYEYTHNYDRLWRKNRRRSSYLCTGTDLNRNWGYKWGGKGSSKQQCKEIYGGTSAFSEPETAAVANFIINNMLNRFDIWKETEVKLVDQIRQLDKQLKSTIDFNNNELRSLRDKLKEAQDTVVTLEFQISKLKAEKLELETSNEELTVDVTRLRCEVEEYKKEMQEWGRKERDRINTLESNAILQGKLSQANTEVTRKQTEIVRLNGEVGKLRGELERIRLGSVINHPSETLNITVSQLQSALNMERENVKEILKEKDSVSKENLDLKRQVKELETIVKRRVKSGNSLPFGFESSFPSQDFKQREAVEQKNKELENHLAALESQQVLNQDAIKGMEAKLQQRRIEHEEELKRLQEENSSLKQALEDQVPKSARRLNSASSNAVSVREDAHLLATIRGLKMELTGRDKEIIRLNKELEDSKRTNRRLQKEREKALNPTTKSRGTNNKEMDKVLPLSLDSGCPGKNYNPLLFEEDQEAVLFLRAENKTLREEIKRLEQDLISLHNKRIQDLSDLQQEHDSAMAQLLREHASKHSSSTVAHLQGQLYTQQMVINHLKQQIKELEERVEEIPVLKAERDQLESTLIEANKKIARLHDLASPESVQYSGLLEKLEFLERRHQVREQKLQSIVRDLISRQSQASGLCTSTCRDKLMNKNREICYYRAEMDRILDTLAEFKWGM